jgi:hypothetical protein
MAQRRAAPAYVVVFATASAVLAGCNHELPPATTIAASLPGPAGNDGSVVFVRPSSPCDTSGYSIVVDEHGRFVGNVDPGTQIAASVAPGPHVFYAWSSLDLRVEAVPAFNTVAAARVEVAPGQTQHVALIVNRPTYNCLDWAVVDLRVIGQSDAYWDELQEALHTAQPVNVDVPAGQATLDAKPALLREYLEMGHTKLVHLEELHAREAQRRAVRAETR